MTPAEILADYEDLEPEDLEAVRAYAGHIDNLWAVEAEARIAAYESGAMQAFTAEEVFSDLETD